jgi:hypothetical protein
LLRAFCHAYGDKVVLLLVAYDKARTRRQNVSKGDRAGTSAADGLVAAATANLIMRVVRADLDGGGAGVRPGPARAVHFWRSEVFKVPESPRYQALISGGNWSS